MEYKVTRTNEKERYYAPVTRIGDADVTHCTGMTRAVGLTND